MTAPRTTTLVRERLLREGRALPRVCVIAAPAGYGKTVLLAQLTSRLGTGGVAAAAREWARDDALLSAARSGTRRRYLAVDDFHELEGTPAEAAILELAEEGPPDLRVVLATRAAPAANLSRLRASGDLRDFTPDDLRFRSWEVDDLFRPAFYRAASGRWKVSLSGGGKDAVAWGDPLSGDIPVPGDYTGDGRHDYAVWRPQTGEWRIRPNGGGDNVFLTWGRRDLLDVPVPGDYTGDGTWDFAVWRESTRAWRIKPAEGTKRRVHFWGRAGDVPL